MSCPRTDWTTCSTCRALVFLSSYSPPSQCCALSAELDFPFMSWTALCFISHFAPPPLPHLGHSYPPPHCLTDLFLFIRPRLTSPARGNSMTMSCHVRGNSVTTCCHYLANLGRIENLSFTQHIMIHCFLGFPVSF